MAREQLMMEAERDSAGGGSAGALNAYKRMIAFDRKLEEEKICRLCGEEVTQYGGGGRGGRGGGGGRGREEFKYDRLELHRKSRFAHKSCVAAEERGEPPLLQQQPPPQLPPTPFDALGATGVRVDWSDALPSGVLNVSVLQSPVLDARDVANASRTCKTW
jgi:hypothetical protein